MEPKFMARFSAWPPVLSILTAFPIRRSFPQRFSSRGETGYRIFFLGLNDLRNRRFGIGFGSVLKPFVKMGFCPADLFHRFLHTRPASPAGALWLFSVISTGSGNTTRLML